jgi:RNA polymerase sigma-70 factor (ECF subfamily)
VTEAAERLASFSELFVRHAPHVERFALGLCRDAALAEDLTAEAFARAWAGPDGLRTETLRGYLLAIVRNLFLEGLRRRRESGGLDERLGDSSPTPDRVAAGREELRRIGPALAGLPETDRSALLLRAEHLLSYEEIGSVLGLSAATARVKVHRARRRLLAARLEAP